MIRHSLIQSQIDVIIKRRQQIDRWESKRVTPEQLEQRRQARLNTPEGRLLAEITRELRVEE
jgi:hypothetical protein